MDLRIFLAYFVVPLVPSLLMLVWMRAWQMNSGDGFFIGMLYYLISLAAMVVLGTPLFLLYRRRGWTTWSLFMLGGGACAALTSGLFLYSSHDLMQQVPMFTLLGVAAGAVFRLILHGTISSSVIHHKNSGDPNESEN